MDKASRYWLLISVDSFGKIRCDELKENRDFFSQQFPELSQQENLRERGIQRQLMQWYQYDDILRQLAEGCLRCFISHQIKDTCQGLAEKFGKKHNFTSAELLPLVVDSHRMRNSNPQSLTTRILQTFDPEQSNLSTWTNRILKSDRIVKQFLLDHGIEQVTDWMILNYMTPGRLARILSDYQQTPTEINQAVELLDNYHQVYRTHLLQIRRTGAKTRYPEPTLEQLRQIADLCQNAKPHVWVNKISPEQVREQLQNLASLLREERIRSRKGLSRLESLNQNQQTINISQPENNEQSDFLAEYQQKIDECLMKSAVLVIQNRFDYLQRKKNPRSQKKAYNYITGLYLFHCQGVSMANIATELELTDQPEVSRLLEITNLRKDIGRNTLSCLIKSILEVAKTYVTAEQLKNLDNKIQPIVEQKIQTIIEQARKDASTGTQQVKNNQLAQAICQCLKDRTEIIRRK
ncbi:hypothetical protein JYQ62_23380 [Nostoc sp. UHCC 0702]|nr:hypothetical protein JYQ62_23380 [Nostoc sp. UHCC 0702]